MVAPGHHKSTSRQRNKEPTARVELLSISRLPGDRRRRLSGAGRLAVAKANGGQDDARARSRIFGQPHAIAPPRPQRRLPRRTASLLAIRRGTHSIVVRAAAARRNPDMAVAARPRCPTACQTRWERCSANRNGTHRRGQTRRLSGQPILLPAVALAPKISMRARHVLHCARQRL